jgi:hypothetical protein
VNQDEMIKKLSNELKESLMKKFDGERMTPRVFENVKNVIAKQLTSNFPEMKITDHIEIKVDQDHLDRTKLNIQLIPKDDIGYDFLLKAQGDNNV